MAGDAAAVPMEPLDMERQREAEAERARPPEMRAMEGMAMVEKTSGDEMRCGLNSSQISIDSSHSQSSFGSATIT